MTNENTNHQQEEQNPAAEETGSESADLSPGEHSAEAAGSDEASEATETAGATAADDEAAESDSQATDSAADSQTDLPQSGGESSDCSDNHADKPASEEGASDEADEAVDFPEASFEMLLMTHHTQAIMALGMVADPISGETTKNKSAAKFHIDMLGIIEEKTKNNLNEQETETLGAILHQLRMAFMNS